MRHAYFCDGDGPYERLQRALKADAVDQSGEEGMQGGVVDAEPGCLPLRKGLQENVGLLQETDQGLSSTGALMSRVTLFLPRFQGTSPGLDRPDPTSGGSILVRVAP